MKDSYSIHTVRPAAAPEAQAHRKLPGRSGSAARQIHVSILVQSGPTLLHSSTTLMYRQQLVADLGESIDAVNTAFPRELFSMSRLVQHFPEADLWPAWFSGGSTTLRCGTKDHVLLVPQSRQRINSGRSPCRRIASENRGA